MPKHLRNGLLTTQALDNNQNAQVPAGERDAKRARQHDIAAVAAEPRMGTHYDAVLLGQLVRLDSNDFYALINRQPRPYAMHLCQDVLSELSRRLKRDSRLLALIEPLMASLIYHLADKEAAHLQHWYKSQQNPSKSIADLFYHCTELSRQQLVKLPIQHLQNLLLDIEALPSITKKNMIDCIYNLGLLAKNKALEGCIRRNVLLRFLEKIGQAELLTAFEINKIISSLGLLAKYNLLDVQFTGEVLTHLLTRLSANQVLSAQDISKTIYGMGLLAKNDALESAVNGQTLNYLLTRLTIDGAVNAQDLSNGLYGLGFIAKAGMLDDNIAAHDLSVVLAKLINLQAVTAQDVSNSLLGLGLMATSGKIFGKISANLLSAVIDKLMTASSLEGLAVDHSISGLKLLLQHAQIEGVMQVVVLQKMLSNLSSMAHISPTQLSNILFDLGTIAQSRQIDKSQQPVDLSLLVSRLCSQRLNLVEVRQSLFGLGQLLVLWPNMQMNIHDIYQLFTILLSQSYIHPAQASSIVDYFVKFKQHANSLMPLFMRSLTALSVPISHFSESVQKNLRGNIQDLSDCSVWRQALEIQLGIAAVTPAAATTRDRSISVTYTPALLLRRFTSSAVRFGDSPDLQDGLNAQDDILPPAVLPMVAGPSSKRMLTPAKPTPIALLRKLTRPASLILPADSKIISQSKVMPKPGSKQEATLNEHDEAWINACKNKIFKLIANKDLDRLSQLLGVTPKTAASPSVAASSPQLPWVSPKIAPNPALPVRLFDFQAKHETANMMASSFLQKTDATALRTLIAQSEYRYFKDLLQACTFHVRYELAKSNALHPIMLYLAEKELKLMVKSMLEPQGLGLYRDQGALKHLIDALTIRSQNKPNEMVSIKALQEEILARALAYNDDKNYHNVVATIKLMQFRLQQSMPIVIEDDEEALGAMLDTTPSQIVASVKPPTGCAAQLLAKTRVNCHYQYESEDIQAILRARLHAQAHVEVLAGALMSQGAQHNRVIDVFRNYLAEHSAQNRRQTVVIPIEIAGHWVGVRFDLSEGQVSNIHYYNSLSNEADSERLNDIVTSLRTAGLLHANASYKLYEASLQQPDATSCGAYLIENIYCDIKSGQWTEASQADFPKIIRKRHLQVLAQHRPDFYPTFLLRQANNLVSVMPKSAQMATHGLSTQGSGFFKEKQNVAPVDKDAMDCSESSLGQGLLP